MSIFDRIDRAHRPPPPKTLDPPQDGDPCPSPHCRSGHYRAALDCNFRRVLRCDGCQAEVPRDDR